MSAAENVVFLGFWFSPRQSLLCFSPGLTLAALSLCVHPPRPAGTLFLNSDSLKMSMFLSPSAADQLYDLVYQSTEAEYEGTAAAAAAPAQDAAAATTLLA
ncbi:hypothetical protein PAMP_006214 [Pampus punctatissimus]